MSNTFVIKRSMKFKRTTKDEKSRGCFNPPPEIEYFHSLSKSSSFKSEKKEKYFERKKELLNKERLAFKLAEDLFRGIR